MQLTSRNKFLNVQKLGGFDFSQLYSMADIRARTLGRMPYLPFILLAGEPVMVGCRQHYET